MSKMWSGRFSHKGTKLLDEFNASLSFDKKLYYEDIQGSIAHSEMLAHVGILTPQEASQIKEGLERILGEIESEKFIFSIEDEDIHMAIEKRLTEIIGDTGKKLHTARSRNDQVALDFRLYVQNSNKKIVKLLQDLIETIVDMADKHTKTLMPGMTHLQHAQPINFGFHMMAYAWMFYRDIARFENSFERNHLLPLGCAALAGTPHPIDRQKTAELLGFNGVTQNCLDTVSDRDFALEILFNISTTMMHISRLAEEMILWSSYEFGFIRLSDLYSTGSSIMPQKKNPDVPELLRGKTGRVNGNLVGLFTVLKGLPLAYNKDMQEDKEGVFDSVETIQISLSILKETIATMEVKVDNMKKACQKGHLSATDLADYLVRECNIPFREAHFVTGKAVAKAEELGIDLSELSFKALHEVDQRINKNVCDFLGLESSMNARCSEGGTSTKTTKHQIDIMKNWLSKRN